MSLLVINLRTEIGAHPEEIIAAAEKYAGIRKEQVVSAAVSKTSVDARHSRPFLVSSVRFDLSVDERKVASDRGNPNVLFKEKQKLQIRYGDKKAEAPVVVAGFGPAGMFAALLLAEHGYPVVVLERGADVDTRTQKVEQFWNGDSLDVSANVQFGEGGAGTFSDGKLTTRIGDSRCEYVLSRFAEFGAPQEILTKAKPHIGTDYLKGIVKAVRKRILSLGGKVYFHTKLTSFSQRGELLEVFAGEKSFSASSLILAIGHSARDTFHMLAECGMLLEQKPFSVGVRIEHLQKKVDEALYGSYAGHPSLPPGEYQLSYRRGSDAVYTFCMCPGGIVVPSSSEKEGIVTNGMSEFARNGANANAALVVSVDSREFGSGLFDGLEFQRRLEQAAYRMSGQSYRAPAMTVGGYLERTAPLVLKSVQPSYPIGVAEGNFSQLFSRRVNDMLRLGLAQFERRLAGFSDPDAVMTGPETRTSSPIRILRNELLEAAAFPGIYPCGEGAGYAGGIMSAAVDGIKVAQKIMERYAPSDQKEE